MSKEEKDAALESHLFPTEKRDGEIKGRAVAGGNKQRETVPKEEATSPTVSLEAVLLMAMIDAQEGCDVAAVDIPNAFIQTKLEDAEDMAIMHLCGKLAESMVQVAPETHAKHVTFNEKGELILHVQLKNMLCGVVKAVLLCHCKFCEKVKSTGFELNPCEPCVANKIVEGKQLTICWHVDDLKISHVRPCVVARLVKWLKWNFKLIFPDGSGAMKACRGKIHEHLGMTLDCSTPGEVKALMILHIKDIISHFDKHNNNSTNTAATPASDHSFAVREDAPALSEHKAATFHHFVAESLFATKHAHPDVSVAVAFLLTRVCCPDEDDWKKLVRMM